MMVVRQILKLLRSAGPGPNGNVGAATAGSSAPVGREQRGENRPVPSEWYSLTREQTAYVLGLTLPETLDDADFDRLMKAVLEHVAADPGGGWVLDLTALDYAGSAMLGLMVNLRQTVRAAGGRLALCGVSPRLLQILQTCSLERLFSIHRTRPDAVRAAS
jgi:anti-anti-sigma factor